MAYHHINFVPNVIIHFFKHRNLGLNPALCPSVCPPFPVLCCPMQVEDLQWADCSGKQ
jgi:hypothetical protein